MGRNKKNRLENALEKLAKRMNDQCTYIHECKEPFCTDKFGRYYGCKRFIHRNPRTNSNDYLQYKGDSE